MEEYKEEVRWGWGGGKNKLNQPVAKSVWCTLMAMAKTYFASRNHTSSVRAFQTLDMYDSYVGSIQMLSQSWIHQRSPDWDETIWKLLFDPDVHTMDDFWGF
jgi:hypothetical protein